MLDVKFETFRYAVVIRRPLLLRLRLDEHLELALASYALRYKVWLTSSDDFSVICIILVICRYVLEFHTIYEVSRQLVSTEEIYGSITAMWKNYNEARKKDETIKTIANPLSSRLLCRCDSSCFNNCRSCVINFPHTVNYLVNI